MREGTGVALAIGGLLAGFFAGLAAIVVVVTYLFVCVYAITKWIGDPDGHPGAVTIIVGFLVLVSLLVLAVLLVVRLLGWSFVSRRREDRHPTT